MGKCQYCGTVKKGVRERPNLDGMLCRACATKLRAAKMSQGWLPDGRAGVEQDYHEMRTRVGRWTCSFGCVYEATSIEAAWHNDREHPAEMAAWRKSMARLGKRNRGGPSKRVLALEAENRRLRSWVDELERKLESAAR